MNNPVNSISASRWAKVFVCIPCLLLGGSEIATLQMVQALSAVGYEVTVIVYYERDPMMEERYRNAGAKLLFLNEKRSGLHGLWRLLWILVDLFRLEKPDVVHGVYFAPGMIPLLAARIARVRNVFATVHAAGNNGYSFKSKAMLRFSAAICSHFFCVAENTERFWFGNMISTKRHSTIRNGVDVELLQSAKKIQIQGIDPDDFIIGIVGRVVKLKGHDCLFRAVTHLVNEIPRLKVLVVGEGESIGDFKKLAEDLGIAERIIWLGRVEPEVLGGVYKTLDILAMPSHWEGFGLTAAEAMAVGIPVVASDVPGLQEVLGNTGKLFPVDDDVALADAIRTIFAKYSAYVSAAQERAEKCFNLHDRQNEWIAFYNSGSK